MCSLQEPSSQHYSSRQTLVSSPCTDLPQTFETLDNFNPEVNHLKAIFSCISVIIFCICLDYFTIRNLPMCQSGQLFYVGLSSTYCLPPMDSSLPHLPSYESVRKKDRQRQIHMMIADRFGLNGPAPAVTEVRPFVFHKHQFTSEVDYNNRITRVCAPVLTQSYCSCMLCNWTRR